MKEQIEEIAKTLCHHYNTRHCEVCDHHGRCMVRLDAECIYNAGYRKQSENTVELPCKAGDLVHFKGLETPWKVSAIHFYAEGLPQISITSETGKITSTMNINEFYMFCSVIAKEETKMKGGE